MKHKSLPGREEKKPQQRKTLHDVAKEMKQRLVDERIKKKEQQAQEARKAEEDAVMDLILGPQRRPNEKAA